MGVDQNTQGERIAKLESKVEALTEKLEENNAHLKETKSVLTAIKHDVSNLHTALERYRGFLGGIILVVSSLWGIFVTFKTWFMTKFGVPS